MTANAKGAGPLARLYTAFGISGPVALLLLAAALGVPWLPGEFWTHVGTEVLILGLFAMSFNLLYGYMGQISFGHAAFFGVGAYATAMLFTVLKPADGQIGVVDFLLSLLVGPPVAALAALVVGFFCVRLTGIYFAILTLAFGELLFYIVFSWYSFTKGDDGIQGLLPPPFFQDSTNFYFFTLAIVVTAAALMWRITESPFGYALRTLRDNQRRAAFLGTNVRVHMLANFVIAGSFAGVAGALWGPFSRSVNPGLLGWGESGIAVFMTLIGGGGSFIGPMVGSVIYTLLQAVVKMYTVYWPLTIGTIILLIVLFAPGGVLGLIDQRIRGARSAERVGREEDEAAAAAAERQP
ncbi:MAG: branched-chain amino acid ABC transporter permease [Betaproteobacteria bacterium]|nr:MAG: branched-chain amino acid ABC transporter permease [Betaproteobacteria bacterium]